MAPAMRPGDWMCDQCGHHNFAKRDVCGKCGASKEGGLDGQSSGPIRSFSSRASRDSGPYNAFGARQQASAPARQEASTPRRQRGAEGKEGDWICPECGNNNFASRVHCNKCNYVRDGFRDGDWVCRSCMHHNFARNDSCKKCGAERVPEPDRVPERAGRAGRAGKAERAERPAERSRPGPSVAPSMAPHLVPTVDIRAPTAQPMPSPVMAGPNDPMMQAMLHQAYMAGIAAGGGGGAPRAHGDGGRGGRSGGERERGGQKQQKKEKAKPANWHEGDWICKKCDNHNWAKRTTCNKCGEMRPRYKPGDWTCPACKAHNFKSRMECHKCSAPRPADSMEAGLAEGEEEVLGGDEFVLENDEMGLQEE